MDIFSYYQAAVDLATDPLHTVWVAPLCLFADACLTGLIVWKMPYTEIDYKTYILQSQIFLQGERDYTLLKGPTGPCVYPAGHIYIYSALGWLTGGGEDAGTKIDGIWKAQWVFAGIYLGTLAIVMACGRQMRAPPYVFPLLVLSKRLHSIYMLRLFNDCLAAGALFVAIYAYQKRWWTTGSIIYSLGVGVKMSVLLALPGVVMVLGQAMPVGRAMRNLFYMVQVQVLLALPFLPVNAKGYFSSAFEFTRQFLFKWTVNWRFVGEKTFLSPEFSLSLVLAHLVILAVFTITRWSRPSGLSVYGLIRRIFKSLPHEAEHQMHRRITPDFMMTTILSSMIIGMLTTRSLHYQFFAYIAWATPFLLWKSGFHPILMYLIYLFQEWSWDVYPSSNLSSMVVVGCLALQVFCVWWGTRTHFKSKKITVDRKDR